MDLHLKIDVFIANLVWFDGDFDLTGHPHLINQTLIISSLKFKIINKLVLLEITWPRKKGEETIKMRMNWKFHELPFMIHFNWLKAIAKQLISLEGKYSVTWVVQLSLVLSYLFN